MSDEATGIMKALKFEKELSFLVPYIFEEETRHSNIHSPSSLARKEHEGGEVRSDHDVMNDTGKITENASDISALSPSFSTSNPMHMNRRCKENKLVQLRLLMNI
jgi:hypothetical protein